MSPLKFALVAGTALALSAPAAAQTVGPASSQRQDVQIRVQNSFNFFVPGATGDSAEARKSRDDARRLIYEMAAKECDLLREALAKDCRLESVQNNISTQARQFGPQQPEGYTVNGSMNFQITVK
jgi:hypothetical protein